MLVRVDDFPHLSPKEFHGHLYFDDYKEKALQWILPFEKHKIDYILGVTPLLIDESDIEFLNEHIKHGRIVMHGFDHSFASWKILQSLNIPITSTWNNGGEFVNWNRKELSIRYNLCNKYMKDILRYDENHFIPPFNAITQNLLDFLNEETKVSTIHDTSICNEQQNHNRFNYGNLNNMIAISNKESADIKTVINNLTKKTKYIVLHWIFDYQNLDDYGTLAEHIRKINDE